MIDNPKHTATPGPWDYEPRTLEVFQATFKHPSVAMVVPKGEQGEANARLIAAAPALLEALQRLLSVATGFALDQQSDCAGDAMDAARYAIRVASWVPVVAYRLAPKSNGD